MKTLALAVALMLATRAAHADDRTDLAKKDVTAALAAQAAGNYDEAIELYKRAYDVVPHPELLFDLGQAYRLKGDVETALDYYQRYLSVEPKGRVSKDAAHWVGELQRQLDARKAERATAAAEQARQAEAARKAEETTTTMTPPPTPPSPTTGVTTTATVAPWPAHSHRRAYAIAAFSVGGAAVITGLVFGELANRKLSDANQLCPSKTCATDADTTQANSLLDQSRLRGDVSTGLVVVGAIGIAAGAYLWWSSHASDGAPRMTIAPTATSSQVGVMIGGAF